jgi:hypothetical protein
MTFNIDGLILSPCLQAFGEPVLYTQSSVTRTVSGVFDAAFMPLLPLGGGMGHEGLEIGMMGDTAASGPALGVQLSQFTTAPQQKDTLVVRGQSFIVREVRSDGQGSAMLILNEVGS